MSTPFDIFGVVAAAGAKVVAALTFPTGLVTGAATTINGGTVSGTPAIAAGQSVIYLGLSESPTSIYGASATLAGTVLPNTTDRPYTVEARVVDAATTMTSYSAIASAFAASAAVVYSRDVPATISGGFIMGGAWTTGNVTVSDVLFDGTSLNDSTATTIFLDEAHDDAKGATYVGNTAVWLGSTATVIAYGPNPGGGASVITVGAGFDAAPSAGDPFKIVRGGAFGQIVATNLDAPVSEAIGAANAATVMITPYQAASTNPRYSTLTLASIIQNSSPTDTMSIIDGNRNAVDLSGKSLRFVVANITDLGDDEVVFDDALAEAWKYETDDGVGGLTIGTGAGTNQVTIQHAATNNATAALYRWWLWDVDAEVPLALGTLPIKPAIFDIP